MHVFLILTDGWAGAGASTGFDQAGQQSNGSPGAPLYGGESPNTAINDEGMHCTFRLNNFRHALVLPVYSHEAY